MPQCAFLSMQSLDDFECYDHLLIEPLAEYGWQVNEVPWRSKTVNWDQYHVVIIRSPWDYQDDPEQFMQVLKTIDQSSARLENALDIVQWNLDKRYLKDMQTKGISIVPTHWQEHLQWNKIAPLFKEFDTTELIIKPVVSANADHTYRLSAKNLTSQKSTLHNIFDNRPLMIQPFMDNIISEGEYSLFYFAGTYSHAILKTPASGDFRVQEEHGGGLERIDPDPVLHSIGKKTMNALPEKTLYARIDFVRTSNDNFALMELELIEPSLYFNMDKKSPQRFASHFNQWMENKNH